MLAHGERKPRASPPGGRRASGPFRHPAAACRAARHGGPGMRAGSEHGVGGGDRRRAAPPLPGRSRPAVRGAGFSVPTDRAGSCHRHRRRRPRSRSAACWRCRRRESGAVRDREARRRGQEMLAALVRLQRALLDGRPRPGGVARTWPTWRRNSRRPPIPRCARRWRRWPCARGWSWPGYASVRHGLTAVIILAQAMSPWLRAACVAISRATRAPGLLSAPGMPPRSGSRNVRRNPKPMMVTLPPDYRPSEDEDFMNPLQVEYFRQKLLRWRAICCARPMARWPACPKAASTRPTSPTAPASRPTARWNCAPATAPAS